MLVTVDMFKSHFTRDFPYGEDEGTTLQDSDIERALREASLGFNEDLFDKECEKNLAFLYLAAFYLVIDIKNSNSGLSSNAYTSFIASKSVGNVHESYGIPSWVQGNPMYSIYLDNGYGKKYLSYIIPRITGYFYLSQGATTWEV